MTKKFPSVRFLFNGKLFSSKNLMFVANFFVKCSKTKINYLLGNYKNSLTESQFF